MAVDVQPWNRRFRAYTDMIKSGLPTEIAKVLFFIFIVIFLVTLLMGVIRR